MIFCGK